MISGVYGQQSEAQQGSCFVWFPAAYEIERAQPQRGCRV